MEIWDILLVSLKAIFVRLVKEGAALEEYKIPLNDTMFRKSRTEAALQRCSHEKMFGKYAANLQDNIHADVWFQ